jgi:hypothetical protein
MAELIHRDTHDIAQFGPWWTVERQPGFTTDGRVVRFLKHNGRRKLLDQTARWTSAGWDPNRWVPAHPQVPYTLLEIVENHMRKVKP